MIIWTGAGIVVVLIWFLSLALCAGIVKLFPNIETGGFLAALLFLFAGFLCYFFNKLLEKEKGRVMIDKETRQEILIKPRHSLFFIPVKYWSFIHWGFAFLFFAVDLWEHLKR